MAARFLVIWRVLVLVYGLKRMKGGPGIGSSGFGQAKVVSEMSKSSTVDLQVAK